MSTGQVAAALLGTFGGSFLTMIIAVVIFSRLVRAYIHDHEQIEKKLHDDRLAVEKKLHDDRAAAAKQHSDELLESARRSHAETIATVQQVVENARRFPAAVAAQYQRLSADIEELNERVDHIDTRLTKLEGQHKDVTERVDRIITRGGLPT